MADNVFQCNPMCPVPDLRIDIGKLESGITKLHEKQDKIAELAISLQFIQNQLSELKNDQDKLFDRMRAQEKSAVTWDDTVKIVSVVSVLSGIIFGSITFLLKVIK